MPYLAGKYRHGFTLIELLIVIAIISLLVTLAIPSLAKAKQMADQVTCMTRVAGQLRAVHMFATAQDGAMPTGPSFMDPYFQLPVNEVATNNIWIGPAQTYNAHGILLQQYLEHPGAFFCPDDDSSDPQEELDKIVNQSSELAFCSYLYRQLDAQDSPTAIISRLDNNAQGRPVRALIMDMNSLMQIPGVPVRTNHRGKKVSVGFVTGHATYFSTPNDELTMRPGDVMNMSQRLDEIFEYADLLE